MSPFLRMRLVNWKKGRARTAKLPSRLPLIGGKPSLQLRKRWGARLALAPDQLTDPIGLYPLVHIFVEPHCQARLDAASASESSGSDSDVSGGQATPIEVCQVPRVLQVMNSQQTHLLKNGAVKACW